MKLYAKPFYASVFGILLLLQLYLPSFKANVFIQLFVLVAYFIFGQPGFSKNIVKAAIPAAILFLIPFIPVVFNHYALFNIIKDISHFLKPLLGLLLGYLLYRRVNDFNYFVKSIVVLGLISALIHFFIILFLSRTNTIYEIREFGKDNFLELFAIFFLIFYKKFQGERLFANKRTHYIILMTLLLSGLFYFSRTMLAGAAFLLFSIYGYTRITPFTIKVLAVSIACLFGFYAYLYSIKIDRDAPGIENFLYKVKIAPEELFKTKINRENHADLWDHWRGYEAKRALELMKDKPYSYAIGCGYGSLVNLKFFAPLTEDSKGMKYISELHNGYLYLLYKTGILGLLVYVVFLIGLYRRINDQNGIITVFISAIGLFYFFTTLTITGIYNNKDVIIFVLGALLFFEKKRDNHKVVLS